MGRHTAPTKRAAHTKHAAAPKKSKRHPLAQATPALPVLALAVTGIASLSAAALGTAQAATTDGPPSTAGTAVTSQFSTNGAAVEPDQRSAFGPSSRDLARAALEQSPRPKSAGMATAPSDADDEYAGRTVLSTGECEASYYNTGAITANGESFDTSKLTAAHKSLPFNTMVRVTNRANDTSVVVRINDRGPYVAGRCLDLTPPAMKRIAGAAGTADVRYEVLGKKQ